MIFKKIGSITKVTTGQSAPQEQDAFGKKGTPFIRAGSLQSLLAGSDENSLELIDENSAKKYKLKLFPADTILFAKSGMSAKIGRVYRIKNPCYVVSHLAAILPSEHFCPGYLHRWFEANPPSRLIENDAYPSIKTSEIEKIEIPLPTLAEQIRIAAILDKADTIRRKRQQAIQLADDFLRAVFLDMFGDPVTNPKRWEVKPVGEVCHCIVPGRDKPKSFTGTTPWITTNELSHLSVTLKKNEFIGLSEEEIKEVRAKVVPIGSVLMTCVGDLGVVSIAGEDMVINQQLHAFLPSELVTPSFLSFVLASQKVYMLQMASSTTLPYMNKTVCNSVPIILPPKKLQEKFEYVVAEIRKTRVKMAHFDNRPIFQSLSQSVFSGVPNDLNSQADGN